LLSVSEVIASEEVASRDPRKNEVVCNSSQNWNPSCLTKKNVQDLMVVTEGKDMWGQQRKRHFILHLQVFVGKTDSDTTASFSILT